MIVTQIRGKFVSMQLWLGLHTYMGKGWVVLGGMMDRCMVRWERSWSACDR